MILKVLIVEDEDMIRLGLVNTIDWLGMQCSVVGSAPDGVTGLQMIRDLHPDIVMTDIKMPGMNGIDMLEKAQETCSFYSILLTSYAEFEYARRAISLQANEYLLKPLDEEKLRQVIDKIHRDALQRRRQDETITIPEPAAMPALPDGLSSGNPLIDKVLKRIADCSQQRISIESIAGDLFISPSYLSRRFKQVMGRTFLDVLNLHRVQTALRMIREGATSVASISEKTGFSDYKHFCNVFKRYTGMTPREYIRTAKNNLSPGGESQNTIPKEKDVTESQEGPK